MIPLYLDKVASINNSLEGAERMAGYSASHVVASIGGGHIESLNSKGVVAVSTPDAEITQNDLLRVIDAAKAVSLPSSREIILLLISRSSGELVSASFMLDWRLNVSFTEQLIA